jgi:hypothetical protein
MNCRTLVFLMVLAGSGTNAFAADDKGLFAIRGAGLLTCQTFVKERAAASNAYVMIGGWLDGYVTGVNELSRNTFDIVPFVSTELLTVLLDRHCKRNPSDLVFAVMNTLLARLYDNRLPAASPYVDVRVGLDQTRLYAETIVRIQSALAAKGHLPGERTGRWDQATQAALGRYQASVGLKASGFPDQATLWSLLVQSRAGAQGTGGARP